MSGRQQSGGPQIRQQQVELGNHVGLTGGVRHSGGRGDNARRTLGAGRAGGTNRADRALRAGCASSAGRTLRAGRTSGTSGADRTLRAGRASSASSSRVFSGALFLLYGQPPGENLRESASFLAKNLTKSQIVRTIEVLQKYRGECAYNIGPGHVLGALAVELEEIF